MRVYLDSAPGIYAIEEIQPYASAVDALLARPDVVQVASDLTRLECRVKPLRDGDVRILAAFDLYFSGTVHEVIQLTTEVLDRATAIRALYGFKTADAIHLAAALHAKCDVFLTNDHRLRRFSEIKVEAVEAPGPHDEPMAIM